MKKHGYSSKKLNELLIKIFIEKKIDNFILVGDDYSDYCIGGNRYVIKDVDDKVIYEKESPITIEDLFENCLPDNITKSAIEKLLKYNLTVYNDADTILFPIKLKQSIQGYIENEEKIPFFLFNGNWLMFDTNYIDNLDNEYKKNYIDLIKIDKKLADIITNKNPELTEDSYNKEFSQSNDLIVAHTVLSNNIELADLIYFDNDNLYLIHNKSKFQGNGARDVLNQILTSAEFINHYLMEKDKREIFGKYYHDIIKKYPNNNKIKTLTEDEFVDLFKKPNIYYIAGFMEGLSDSSESNYAKYITLDASKKLKEKGYNLLLFNINS